MRTILSLITALAVIAPACASKTPEPAPQPTPPPSPYQGDPEKGCASACANLRRLECPEGNGSVAGTCDRVCVRALELRTLPLDCWAVASDVAAVRGCGSLPCVR